MSWFNLLDLILRLFLSDVSIVAGFRSYGERSFFQFWIVVVDWFETTHRVKIGLEIAGYFSSLGKRCNKKNELFLRQKNICF